MPVFDAESDDLPRLRDLETIPGAPEHAAWFWGVHDEARIPIKRPFDLLLHLCPQALVSNG